MLIRKECRYDSQGRLIKDKYYFWKFPILKYILSYPNALNEYDWITARVYLFGLPLWKNYVSSNVLDRGSVLGGGIILLMLPILWQSILVNF